MPLITLTSGRTFDANEGESLLDAALRAGVVLEHSCRTGRCSSCKGRVLNGESFALHDEPGLDCAEREAGFILTCVRSARVDVTLQAEDLGNVRLHAPRTWPCRLQSLERLAPDVLRVVLRLPPTSDFRFHAGQYVDVIGPGGVRRSYSIANAPRADKLIELHVREVENGSFSQYWFEQAQVNDLLRLRGPLGTFFLRDVAGLDLVFLATGTGMAPVKAILEHLPHMPVGELPRSVTVYWGGRRPEDLYWDASSLSTSQRPVTPLRYVPVVSRGDTAWPGRRGHVQDALLADAPDWRRTVVYACGSDAMIHEASVRLTDAGLPEGRFHSDAFVCSAPT